MRLWMIVMRLCMSSKDDSDEIVYAKSKSELSMWSGSI